MIEVDKLLDRIDRQDEVIRRLDAVLVEACKALGKATSELKIKEEKIEMLENDLRALYEQLESTPYS